MSHNAWHFVALANWADAEWDRCLTPWEESRLLDVWSKLRDRAGYLIGFMAS